MEQILNQEKGRILEWISKKIRLCKLKAKSKE